MVYRHSQMGLRLALMLSSGARATALSNPVLLVCRNAATLQQQLLPSGWVKVQKHRAPHRRASQRRWQDACPIARERILRQLPCKL